MLSVGRAQLTLRKVENATWARLLKSSKKLPNMHVWWTMREKLEKEEAAANSSPAPSASTLPAVVTTATPTPSESSVTISVGGDAAPIVVQVASASPTAEAGSATPSKGTTASKTSVPSVLNDRDDEVLEAEDEEAPAATVVASTPSRSKKPTSVKKAPTTESAAARRRRLAQEKAKGSKAGGPATATPFPTPGQDGGAFGLGKSFTTAQLYGQLAGSIEARRYAALKEDEDAERDEMAKVDAWVRQQKSLVNKNFPDEESRSLERVRIDEMGRYKRAEAREAIQFKRKETIAKYDKEASDLQEQLNFKPDGK